MKVKSEHEVAQSCPILSDPMDCSLPGSSIHGIFQARVLEWGAIAFSVLYYKQSKISDPSQFFTGIQSESRTQPGHIRRGLATSKTALQRKGLTFLGLAHLVLQKQTQGREYESKRPRIYHVNIAYFITFTMTQTLFSVHYINSLLFNNILYSYNCYSQSMDEGTRAEKG